MSFDGKLLAQGCFGEGNGDVDLWGHEGTITLHQALRKCHKLIAFVDSLKKPVSKRNVQSFILKLQSMTCKISKEIRKLCAKVKSEFFA